MNKILLTTTLLLSALSLSSAVNARPEYIAPTGAAGCTSCHNDNFGNGYKSSVLTAFNSGGLQGLYNLLHPVTTPNTAPVLSAINSQWDVTVGEVGLVIPLSVSDKQGDSFNINGSITPTVTGMTISNVYNDSKTNLPTKDLKWTPTAAQGNKNYMLKVYAKESSNGHSLSSNSVSTNIHVWPARVSATKNVKQFVLQNAQWSANKLTLSGLVIFKPTVTATQRSTYLNTLTLSMRSNLGAVIVGSPAKLAPNSTGAWTKTFTLTGSQVPCLIKVTYEGLNAARTVKSAPTTSCVK